MESELLASVGPHFWTLKSKYFSFEGHKINSFVGLMGKRSQEEPGKFNSRKFCSCFRSVVFTYSTDSKCVLKHTVFSLCRVLRMEHNTDVRQEALSSNHLPASHLITPHPLEGSWCLFCFSQMCIAVSWINWLFSHCSDVAVLHLCQSLLSQQKVQWGKTKRETASLSMLSGFCESFLPSAVPLRPNVVAGCQSKAIPQGMLKIVLPTSLHSAS